MCLKIWELDPACFHSAHGLAWQRALKKAKVKLDLLTDIDMLFMVEKGIRGRLHHSIYQYAKANSKYLKYWDQKSDEGYFLKLMFKILKNDLTFLSENMKIEKSRNSAANIHDKTEYVIIIRNLKNTLNHGFVLKKFHRVITFNKNSWLKPYIDMNTDLRKKNDFEK